MKLSNKYKLLAYGRALARSGMFVSGLIMIVLQFMAIAFTPLLQVILFSILGLGIASNALEVAAYLYGHAHENKYARDVNLKWFSPVCRLFFEPAFSIVVLTLSLSQPANTVVLFGLLAIFTQKFCRMGWLMMYTSEETEKIGLKIFDLVATGILVFVSCCCFFLHGSGLTTLISG